MVSTAAPSSRRGRRSSADATRRFPERPFGNLHPEMAISYDQQRLATRQFGGVARAFVFGREAPASRWIGARLTTLFARGERALPEDRPPLAESLAKLALWIVVGIAVTSGACVVAGALVIRMYTGAFG